VRLPQGSPHPADAGKTDAPWEDGVIIEANRELPFSLFSLMY